LSHQNQKSYVVKLLGLPVASETVWNSDIQQLINIWSHAPTKISSSLAFNHKKAPKLSLNSGQLVWVITNLWMNLRISTKLLKILCYHVDPTYELHSSTDGSNDMDFSSSVLRILRYPPTKPNEVVAPDHTDIGTITLAACSDVPGLQILSRRFEWIEVEEQDSDTPCMALFVGEQLAYLSNYYYLPTRHRVMGTRLDRISFPFLSRMSADRSLKQIGTNRTELCLNIKPTIFEMPEHSRCTLRMASVLADRIYQSEPKNYHSINVVGSLASTEIDCYDKQALGLMAFVYSQQSQAPRVLHTIVNQLKGTISRSGPWHQEEITGLKIRTSLFDFQVSGMAIQIQILEIETLMSQLQSQGCSSVEMEAFSSLLSNAIPLVNPSNFHALCHSLKPTKAAILNRIKGSIMFPSRDEANLILFTHSFEDLWELVIRPIRQLILKMIFASNGICFPAQSQFQNIFSIQFPKMKLPGHNFIEAWFNSTEIVGNKTKSSLDMLYQLLSQTLLLFQTEVELEEDAVELFSKCNLGQPRNRQVDCQQAEAMCLALESLDKL